VLPLALREPERDGSVDDTVNMSVKDGVRVPVPEWVVEGAHVKEGEPVAVMEQEVLTVGLALLVQLPEREAERDILPEPLTLGAVLLPVPLPSLELLKDMDGLQLPVKEVVAALTEALAVDPVALPVQE